MRRPLRYWPLVVVVGIVVLQFVTLLIFQPRGGNHWDAGWGGAPEPLPLLAGSATFGPVLDALGVLVLAAATRLLKRLWQRLPLAVRVGATLYLAGQVANFAYRLVSPWLVGDLGVANLWSGGVGNVADLAIALSLPVALAMWAAPEMSAWFRRGGWRPRFRGVTAALAAVVLLAGAGGAWATGEASYQARTRAAAAQAKTVARRAAAPLRAERARRRVDSALRQAAFEDHVALARTPDGLSWDDPPVMASGGSVHLQPVAGPAGLARLEATPSRNWVVLVRGAVQTPEMLAWLALPPLAQAGACKVDLVQKIDPDIVSACMDGFSSAFSPSDAGVQAHPPWWLADQLAALGITGSTPSSVASR